MVMHILTENISEMVTDWVNFTIAIPLLSKRQIHVQFLLEHLHMTIAHCKC